VQRSVEALLPQAKVTDESRPAAGDERGLNQPPGELPDRLLSRFAWRQISMPAVLFFYLHGRTAIKPGTHVGDVGHSKHPGNWHDILRA
jgi:hypothetical protein